MGEPRQGSVQALVFGGSGLVGGAVLRAAERAGWDAVGTHCSHAQPGSLRVDVRQPALMRDAIRQTRPSVIVAAVNTPGGVDYCETHSEDARATHVDGAAAMAQEAAACGALLVYYSTDYLFDGAAGPYAEEAPARPISAYGRAKWEAEEAIRRSGVQHLILRTTAVFGWDRRSKNFAMQLWERLQAQQPMRVPDDQWCNPTLADYLAEITLRLIEGQARGVFNVVGKERLTRADFAAALARALALDASLIQPVPTAALGQQAARPLQGGLTTAKLEAALGTPAIDLAESLKRFRRQWRLDTHVQVPVSTGGGSDAERLRRRILDDARHYAALAHAPRPFVPFKTRVQYAGRVVGAEEVMKLVESALDCWLTLGPFGDQFEQQMKRFFGASDFVLVNSGSTANLTAVMALMSGQVERPLIAGDEVITPAVTFPTTLAPLVHGGLVPVLVDCDMGTYNINPDLLEQAISPATRALMVPHTLGNPCDLDRLVETARRHQLYLVEDACDALGSTFNGRLVGTFGDLATLSFFPAHHITMGEGGGVIVNRPRLSRIVRSVRDWGRDCWCAPGESNTCGTRFGWQLGGLPKGYDHKFTYSNLGYNFKPTDMQAAIGVAQAARLPDFIAKRRANFRRLYEGLQPYQEQLLLPRWDPRADPAWFGFPITVQGELDRASLVQWLERANIETRQIFAGNILKQPAYRNIRARVAGTLEQTDRVMRDTFFIGVYPGLTEEMLAFVLEQFRAFFAQWKSPNVVAAGGAQR